MLKIKRIIFLWLPPIVWMGLIFFLSSFHKLQVSEGIDDFILRKIAHMVEYLILFLLLYRAIKNTTNYSINKNLNFAFLFSMIYAFTDEFHQSFVLGRSGNLRDIAIDIMGIFLGWIFFKKWKKNKTKGEI